MDRLANVAAAIAAFQRGDLVKTRELAERQLANGDHLPELQNLIGLVECRLGRFEAGVDWLRRALQADPANGGFRLALARALVDGGRAHEALAVTEVSAAAPIELWRVRAEAAFATGDRAIESEAWQVICANQTRDALAWTNLGRSLFDQSRFGEAETAYRKALLIAPSDVTALRGLGLTFERTNQLGAVRELLGRALEAGIPKSHLADLWALRELRKGRGAKAWSLVRSIDTAADPVRLNELKAKAADAAGHSNEAFAAAAAMNRATPGYAAWRVVGRDFRKQLRGVHGTMAAWPRDLPRAPPTDRRSPAFLVGFPRSGTTLADTFLMGHPDVHVLEEVQLLTAAARSFPAELDLPLAKPEQLVAARDIYFAEMDRHLEPGFDGLVIDKLPLNMFSLPLIASLFPDARVIFVHRHPLDSVLSAYMQNFRLNAAMASFLDLADAAEFYDLGMQLFMRARERTGLAMHALVYEQLIADPAGVLRPTVDFLGLEWRSQLLDHRRTAAQRGPIATPSYGQVSEPLSMRPSGRWRRYRKQLEPVLPVLLPWAERLGYPD